MIELHIRCDTVKEKGDCTFVGHNRCSVIDYVIGSCLISRNDSEHLPMAFNLSTNIDFLETTIEVRSGDHLISTKYSWLEDKGSVFIEMLASLNEDLRS